ncbi:hypothetical protein K2Z83_14370 [Oscillochloris sp. ZM17-4]|nr:hypothetical protein [Oscillochloris sp. ZM17-4]MBX0328861.1 hypothetical protein [Oscillochloris sp. ZM17-4]
MPLLEEAINWWGNAPYLTTRARALTDENRLLHERIDLIEARLSANQ